MERETGGTQQSRRDWRTLVSAVRRPDVQTELVQIVKTVIATVLAFWVATDVFDLKQAFLAAWVALLTVHATVYRTFWRGAQSVIAAGVGILVSFGAVQLLGIGMLALALAVLAGLLIAKTPLIRQEGVTVATTAVFVITAGSADQEVLLIHRFLDTAIGVVVGLAINLIIRPPLDDRVAEGAIDEALASLSDLLQRIGQDFERPVTAEDVDAWLEETRAIDAAVDRAEGQLSFARESQWGNPRRRRSPWTIDVDLGAQLLDRLEGGVAHVRAIARVVAEALAREQEWDAEFRRRWTSLVVEVGAWVAEPDDAATGPLLQEVDELTRAMSGDALPESHWPVYGALLTALGNVVTILGDIKVRRDELAAP
jgi:hypothetical protein